MNKKILAVFVGLLVIGLVSAAVVNYLSQNATATITVGIPLVNELSDDSGATWAKDISISSFDGTPVVIDIKTENKLTTTVVGTPNDRITGTDITCADFSINVTGNNVVDNIACVNVGDTNTTLNLAVRNAIGATSSWAGSETKSYQIEISFVPGAMGTYTFQSQVMV